MALTFYWRCEGTSLDATHDYSAGDTSGALQVSAAINSTAALVGSNGLYVAEFGDSCDFTGTSITSASEGAAACWFRFASTISNNPALLVFKGTGDDYVWLDVSGDELRLRTRQDGDVSEEIITTSANLTVDTTYFVIIKWRASSPYRAIELYDSAGSAISGGWVSSTSSYRSPGGLAATVKIGDDGAGGVTTYIDNVFIGSSIDDGATFLEKRSITSYTEYAGTPIAAIAAYYRMLRDA